MKKTYINPTLYSRKVVVNNILAGSLDLNETPAQSSEETQKGSGNGGDGLAKDSWGVDWGE